MRASGVCGSGRFARGGTDDAVRPFSVVAPGLSTQTRLAAFSGVTLRTARSSTGSRRARMSSSAAPHPSHTSEH